MPGCAVGVHARRRVVAARGGAVRIGHLDFDGIAGELGLGADELKAASLRTVLRPPSQPTSQRARKVSPPARTVTSSSDASKPSTPRPRRISTPIARARAASTVSRCSISTAMLVLGRAWQAIRPSRRRCRRGRTGCRRSGRPGGAAAASSARQPLIAARAHRCGAARNVVQQAATVEGLDGGHGKAAHAERAAASAASAGLGLLQHQHGEAGEAQLAGEKQADRTGAGNDDVIRIGNESCMRLLLGRCSTGAFLELENHTDERLGA